MTHQGTLDERRRPVREPAILDITAAGEGYHAGICLVLPTPASSS